MTPTDSIQCYEQTTKMGGASFSVEDYIPLVKRIAHHLKARMPASVQVEDLIQAGMIGLLEAAKKFDDSLGASFETYAGIRIRGAIIDEMRRGDWVPRSVHRNARKINDAIVHLEASLGRDPSAVEVAKFLEMDLDEYYAVSQDVISGRLFSLDDSDSEDDKNQVSESLNDGGRLPMPHDAIQKTALKEGLAEAIRSLPERDQLVLSLYYQEELNLKEIGAVLEVSESRVSQIHSQAALRLRAKMRDWL